MTSKALQSHARSQRHKTLGLVFSKFSPIVRDSDTLLPLIRDMGIANKNGKLQKKKKKKKKKKINGDKNIALFDQQDSTENFLNYSCFLLLLKLLNTARTAEGRMEGALAA